MADSTLGLTGAELTRARISQRRSSSVTGSTNSETTSSFIQEQPEASSSYQSKQTTYANLDASQIKELVGNLALTNLYQVNFSAITEGLKKQLGLYTDKSLDEGWISQNAGLLCTEASLPTSSFATSEVKDNFIGVTQEFAHTRLYTDLDLTFYVDGDYNIIQFFESWMDYISGSSEEAASKGSRNHYRRFAYPNDYKIDTLHILKFDKNNLVWGETAGKSFLSLKNNYVLQYDFINVFPKSITTIPVSYGPAELMKVSVSFNYDRYIQKRNKKSAVSSLEEFNKEREIRQSLQKTGSSGSVSTQEPISAEESAAANRTTTTINPTTRRQGTDAFRGRR